jgi:hypothetical protein
VYIQLSIRVESDKVLVWVDESKHAHTVPNGNGAELEPVYKEVFETAKALVKKASKQSKLQESASLLVRQKRRPRVPVTA